MEDDFLSGVNGFSNMKLAKYFAEFDLEACSIEEVLQLINMNFDGWKIRVLEYPEDLQKNLDCLVPVVVDLQWKEDVDLLADFLYDSSLIDDEEYENFEELFVGMYS